MPASGGDTMVSGGHHATKDRPLLAAAREMGIAYETRLERAK